jgi:hypothetical protein
MDVAHRARAQTAELPAANSNACRSRGRWPTGQPASRHPGRRADGAAGQRKGPGGGAETHNQMATQYHMAVIVVTTSRSSPASGACTRPAMRARKMSTAMGEASEPAAPARPGRRPRLQWTAASPRDALGPLSGDMEATYIQGYPGGDKSPARQDEAPSKGGACVPDRPVDRRGICAGQRWHGAGSRAWVVARPASVPTTRRAGP